MLQGAAQFMVTQKLPSFTSHEAIGGNVPVEADIHCRAINNVCLHLHEHDIRCLRTHCLRAPSKTPTSRPTRADIS